MRPRMKYRQGVRQQGVSYIEMHSTLLSAVVSTVFAVTALRNLLDD